VVFIQIEVIIQIYINSLMKILIRFVVVLIKMKIFFKTLQKQDKI